MNVGIIEPSSPKTTKKCNWKAKDTNYITTQDWQGMLIKSRIIRVSKDLSILHFYSKHIVYT